MPTSQALQQHALLHVFSLFGFTKRKQITYAQKICADGTVPHL